MAQTSFPISDEYDRSLQYFASRIPSEKGMTELPQLGAVLAVERPEMRDDQGRELRPDVLYYDKCPAEAKKHLRRLRKCYTKGGTKAVAAYLVPYVHYLGLQ